MISNNSKLISGILCLVLLGMLWSCDDDNIIVETDWVMVWEQDFDGTAGDRIDDAVWNYDIGTGPADIDPGWGNFELQYYTDRTENVSLDGQGNLAITARSESFAGAAFTSARITTKDNFEISFSRVEARIKLPFGPGYWPAFWMLGANIDEVPWPGCGEIDIMEYKGNETNRVYGSVHGPGYSGERSVSKGFTLENGRFDTDFHVFAIERFENRIDYYVDGILYSRLEPDDVDGDWVYNEPFYILLNVAIGGNFVGFPIEDTQFPQSMLVDYVRVYKEAE